MGNTGIWDAREGIHERGRERPKQRPAGGLKLAAMEEGTEIVDCESLREEGTSWRPRQKMILEREKERTFLAEVTGLPHPHPLRVGSGDHFYR